MAQRKNIFTIARKGSHDHEDQLTELLAWLLQEEPALAPQLLAGLDIADRGGSISVATQQGIVGGRLDLVFESSAVHVVVESKLGSTTDYAQCEKYIKHLASKEAPNRALVLLTKLSEPWPQGVEEIAADLDVRLVARRWWHVTSILRTSRSRLGRDLAELLEEEGLVVPGPMRDDEWGKHDGIPPVAVALLTEAKPELRSLSPGFRSQRMASGRAETYRSIYCLTYFAKAQVGPGLAASWKDLVAHRKLNESNPGIEGAVVAVSVVDPTLPEVARPAAAAQAVSAGGDGIVGACWDKFPTRAAPASSVLTAGDFMGQVGQLLDFTRETVEHFREIGYLKDSS